MQTTWVWIEVSCTVEQHLRCDLLKLILRSEGFVRILWTDEFSAHRRFPPSRQTPHGQGDRRRFPVCVPPPLCLKGSAMPVGTWRGIGWNLGRPDKKKKERKKKKNYRENQCLILAATPPETGSNSMDPVYRGLFIFFQKIGSKRIWSVAVTSGWGDESRGSSDQDLT